MDSMWPAEGPQAKCIVATGGPQQRGGLRPAVIGLSWGVRARTPPALGEWAHGNPEALDGRQGHWGIAEMQETYIYCSRKMLAYLQENSKFAQK